MQASRPVLLHRSADAAHTVERDGPFRVFGPERSTPIIVHQSDLSAIARCMAEYGYKRNGAPATTNSAAAFGSVMHVAVSTFEREVNAGTDQANALAMATETFLHYWNPLAIEAVCEPVPTDGWLPRQSYGSLRQDGVEMLRRYAALKDWQDGTLAATEYGFSVPIVGTWDEELEEPHRLNGSVDRFSYGHYKRFPVIDVSDLKSGKDSPYLRQNLQGTAYCYATTQREFWVGDQGEDGFGADMGQKLYDQTKDWARRFTWISLRSSKFMDGGWRGPNDYERFALAVNQFCDLVRNETYPMSISGAICQYCDFRRICGGVGVPDKNHGRPG